MAQRIYIGVVVVFVLLSIIFFPREELLNQNKKTALEPTPTLMSFARSTVAQDIKTIKFIRQNNTKQKGSVTIKDWSGSATVTINLEVEEEETEDVALPAQLRSGTCSNPGEVKYALENVLEGGETVLNMSVEEFRKMLPLIVTVQLPSDPPKTILCANVTSL